MQALRIDIAGSESEVAKAKKKVIRTRDLITPGGLILINFMQWPDHWWTPKANEVLEKIAQFQNIRTDDMSRADQKRLQQLNIENKRFELQKVSRFTRKSIQLCALPQTQKFLVTSESSRQNWFGWINGDQDNNKPE